MDACSACPRPKLLPCNQPIVYAYLLVQHQWQRAGMGGTRAGMNHIAVRSRIELELTDPASPITQSGMGLLPLIRGIETIETAMLQADMERSQQEDTTDGHA